MNNKSISAVNRILKQASLAGVSMEPVREFAQDVRIWRKPKGIDNSNNPPKEDNRTFGEKVLSSLFPQFEITSKKRKSDEELMQLPRPRSTEISKLGSELGYLDLPSKKQAAAEPSSPSKSLSPAEIKSVIPAELKSPEGRQVINEAALDAFGDLISKNKADMRRRGIIGPGLSSKIKDRYLEDDNLARNLAAGAGAGLVGNAAYRAATGKEQTLGSSALSAIIGAALAPGALAASDLYKDKAKIRAMKNKLLGVMQLMYDESASRMPKNLLS